MCLLIKFKVLKSFKEALQPITLQTQQPRNSAKPHFNENLCDYYFRCGKVGQKAAQTRI